MIQYRFIKLIGVLWLLFAAPVFSQDLIIESSQEGQNSQKYKEIEGVWIDSHSPPKASKSSAPGCTEAEKCGSRKSIFKQDVGGTTLSKSAAARFTPEFAAKGRYDVFATWPQAGNASVVVYTVKHAGGEAKVELKQDGYGATGPPNGNTWVSLGSFEFTPGPDQWVELRVGPGTEPLPNNVGQVYADAVRFAPASAPGVAEPANTAPASPPAPSQPPAGGNAAALSWLASVDAAKKAAAPEKKRILVYVHAAKSELSQHFETAVFPDGEVQRLLGASFVIVKIDIDSSPESAYQLGIFRGGTVRIYNFAGENLGTIRDKVAPDEFHKKLKAFVL